MSKYENFSQVYDIFMSETPYDKWTEYIERIWKKFGCSPKLVAELGCGTGNITERLAKKGYDMIGIDNSENMLIRAKEKNYNKPYSILYLKQDMRKFELYGTVGSIISICDSMNYILNEDELLNTFKLVNNYLDPGGIFIFDMNSLYKFKEILGFNSFGETTKNAAYTWENYFDEHEMINEYYTNFFILDENTGKYDRFEEIHYEKAYYPETIIEIIKKSGLQFIGVFDEFTFDAPKYNSQRIYFVAKEITKRQK